ncbi:MAG: DUF1015 domain-containing protein [Lachnospiraceae bacterium]|nr:DUF1015 domain-containing protein [Lachnospiraceae bacterium]
MADVRPFKALRPAEGKAEHIAALPYDVMDTAEAREEIRREPLSFLAIDRPETGFPEGCDMYAPEVYEKAAEIFERMISDGDFIMDDRELYYIYELTMEGRSQTGIVALCAASDYENNIIKKHENTLEAKEQDRIRHIHALGAQTGPIFLAYRGHSLIDGITERYKAGTPLFDFTSPDGITHRGWMIAGEDDIETIRKCFEKINDIYIADGHHRCASAVRNCRELPPEKSYFLSVLFPDSELKIYDYNRVVRDLNGLSESRFFDRLRKKYTIEALGADAVKPSKKGEMTMYISGVWYRLTIKDEFKVDDPVRSLDVSILQDEVLSPVLNIEDPKTDQRISFVGGIRGLKELERLVDSGEYEVAFAMYPTSIFELFAVADAGRLMPPKSTWFEPKLRSGLFINRYGK